MFNEADQNINGLSQTPQRMRIGYLLDRNSDHIGYRLLDPPQFKRANACTSSMIIHTKILLGTLSLICRPPLFTAYTILPTNRSENRAFHLSPFTSITPRSYIVNLLAQVNGSRTLFWTTYAKQLCSFDVTLKVCKAPTIKKFKCSHRVSQAPS